MAASHIRVVALCLLSFKSKILVCEYFDSVKGTPFYRPPGGAIEFGETSEAAIRREILEETGHEVTSLRLLKVLECIFTHEGKAGHQIVFVYDGAFKDNSVYRQPSLLTSEESGETFTARWYPPDFFNDYHRLVPEALTSILKSGKA